MIHSKAPAVFLDPAGAFTSSICFYALAFCHSTLKQFLIFPVALFFQLVIGNKAE